MMMTIISSHRLSLVLKALIALLCLAVTSKNATAEETNYDTIVKNAEAIVVASEKELHTMLREYVSFKSVSAIDHVYGNETRKCANWVAEKLGTHLGMKDARLLDSGYKYPIVVGSSSGDDADKPAVVIYGHYDVQPIDPIEKWTFDPFKSEEMYIEEGYGHVFTGRGSSDDKGNTFAAMSGLAGLHAILDGGLQSLPINIIVCIEGEEEIGSPGFRQFLQNNMNEFKRSELVLSADGSQPREDRGSLLLSLRGLIAVQLDVIGANSDLHSGTFGGSIMNPIVALSRLITSMHDPLTNRVLLDGFYDDVIELSSDEKKELEQIDDKEEAKSLEVDFMVGETNYTTIERRTIRPTLEVVGIYGGFQDEGIKTVLPSQAHAKIAFRLVGKQDPEKVWDMLNRHVSKYSPTLAPGTKVSVTKLNSGAKPYSTRRDSVGNQIAGSVLDELYGKKHGVFRMGGSIPATAYFHEVLGLETTLLSFGGEKDYIHAPDERWQVKNLSLGQRAYIRMIMKLAKTFGDISGLKTRKRSYASSDIDEL